MHDQIKPSFSMPKTGSAGRSAAGSLLDDLRRRLLPDRPAPRNRWAGWVRELAERYGYGPDRRDAAGLVLVQPYRHIRTVRERWFERTKPSLQKNNVWTQQFFPTINLSVQTVLRASGPTLFGAESSRSVGRVNQYQQLMEERVLIERREFGSETNPISRAGQSPSGAERARLTASESLSPLERVFRRPEKAATLLQEKETSVQASGRDEMMKRLERQSQRIESTADSVMTPALSIKADSPSARKTASQARKTEEQSGEQSAQFAGSDPSSSQRRRDQRSEPNYQTPINRALAQVNIDQITDQVMRQLDQKVIAARERMGRTF